MIAVIAAIAAVIVPQFGNLTGAAKNAADLRNAQLWNDAYANAYALAQSQNLETGYSMPYTADAPVNGSVNEINTSFNLSGQIVNFTSPGFTITGNWTTTNFVLGKGIVLTK